jgi:hypothetical protein
MPHINEPGIYFCEHMKWYDFLCLLIPIVGFAIFVCIWDDKHKQAGVYDVLYTSWTHGCQIRSHTNKGDK